MKSESFHTICTSPPYWGGLRDYEQPGQLGLEPTLEEYLDKMLDITAELKRVLKPSGALFWNHGDNHGGSWQGYGSRKGGQRPRRTTIIKRPGNLTKAAPPSAKMRAKCLTMQNTRLLQRMVDEQGWILRNRIVWHKRNHKPESSKDRFTVSWEPVFFLTKSNKPLYWYNVNTGAVEDKKPKDLKEGVDWDWKVVPSSSNIRVKSASENKYLQNAAVGVIMVIIFVKKWRSWQDFDIEKFLATIYGLRKISYWRSLHYSFDLDAVREPHKESAILRATQGVSAKHKYSAGAQGHLTLHNARPNRTTKVPEEQAEMFGSPRARYHRNQEEGSVATQDCQLHPLGKNPGDVWSIKSPDQAWQQLFEAASQVVGPESALSIFELYLQSMGVPSDVWDISTTGFSGAHFAVYPEGLMERPIRASCPKEVCSKCGKPKIRISEATFSLQDDVSPDHGLRGHEGQKPMDKSNGWQGTHRGTSGHETVGWAKCNCGAPFVPGTVLDPFSGSGTTGVVAMKEGVSYFGIELSLNYAKMSKKRIEPYFISAGQKKLF